MDGRFPFDNQQGGRRAAQQLNSAQMRAALATASAAEAEAFYLQQQQQQQQQDYQRHQNDQLRLILLQEQLDRENQEQQLRAIGDHLHEFPDLQQHYHSLLLNERLQNEQIQRQEDQLYLREQQQRQAAAQLHLQEQLRLRLARGPITNAFSQPEELSSTHNLPAMAETKARSESNASAITAVPEALVAAARNSVGVSSISGQPSPPEAQPPPVTKKRSNSMNNSSNSTQDQPERKQRGRPRKQKAASKKSQHKRKKAGANLEEGRDSPMIYVNESLSNDSSETLPVEAIQTKGTVEELLKAADSDQKADNAADALSALKKIDLDKLSFLEEKKKEEKEEEEEEEDKDKDDASADSQEEQQPTAVPGALFVDTAEPAESISLNNFRSFLPKLPEEPFIEEDSREGELKKADKGDGESDSLNKNKMDIDGPEDFSIHNGAGQHGSPPKHKKVSTVLEYPFPVDTWWPSTAGMRRERRQCGEISDEDAFEESEKQEIGEVPSTLFRADERKICKRLATSLEPGVMEKMPHCRIHRVRTKRKKNSTAPELVYCWQCTEIYPNDIMVNCSICGTWRHAACGGHYEPYSTRANTCIPFTAVCENCHEERRLLKDYPRGEARLERQRMEHLRRALSTSAVMRHASFSKHGGTYKWPLGSVSATHIGGHTRSVHARHDKAEKQWTDMATRLGRGYGYRPKERVRVRTKELERLLVSVEDAEGFTERHNMLLFLLRDTARERPIGFEGERRNIFDPSEDPESEEESDEDMSALPPPPSDGVLALPTDHADDRKDGSKNKLDLDFRSNHDSQAKDGEEREKLWDQEQHNSSVGRLPHISQKQQREEEDVSEVKSDVCARIGCSRPNRFDSRFCSDACGVSVLELDLLRTFQDASDIHPSVLRH